MEVLPGVATPDNSVIDLSTGAPRSVTALPAISCQVCQAFIPAAICPGVEFCITSGYMRVTCVSHAWAGSKRHCRFPAVFMPRSRRQKALNRAAWRSEFIGKRGELVHLIRFREQWLFIGLLS